MGALTCLAVLVLADALSPSEAYLAEARRLYPLPEYEACTNSIVRRWKVSGADRCDRPVPGGKIGWVEVEGMRNVRDIGGWTGLRTGRAFRGTEPDGHQKDGKYVHGLHVTSNGLVTVRSVMGIRTDLDLRGVGECPHPDRSELGVTLVRIPVRAYDGFESTKTNWAKALRLFADPQRYPIYFHCWGGADRTGVLAFLLEGLCGVAECDLSIDYELTSFSLFPRARDPEGLSKGGFSGLLALIKSRPGATLKDKFADFAEKELGLTPQEVKAIRQNLTGYPDLSRFAFRARGDLVQYAS